MSDAHFRRSAREPVSLRVLFRHEGSEGRLERTGHVRDLSVGGAFVATGAAAGMSAGELVRLQFTLPSAWDPVEIVGEVRWTTSEGFGVSFASLTTEHANALRGMLEQLDFDED